MVLNGYQSMITQDCRSRRNQVYLEIWRSAGMSVKLCKDPFPLGWKRAVFFREVGIDDEGGWKGECVVVGWSAGDD